MCVPLVPNTLGRVLSPAYVFPSEWFQEGFNPQVMAIGGWQDHDRPGAQLVHKPIRACMTIQTQVVFV